MDNASRLATLIAWIDCESCGRIDKAAQEFNYPADMAEGMELFVWMPGEPRGQQAKLHKRREIKPAY